jgi:hypothetical protein
MINEFLNLFEYEKYSFDNICVDGAWVADRLPAT